MRLSGRFLGRSSLLLLSVALTVGPGVADSTGRAREFEQPPADRAYDVATPLPSTAPGAVAVMARTVDRPAVDRAPAVVSTPVPAAQAPASTSIDCGDAETVRPDAAARAHPDDVTAHPERGMAGPCPLAGPKRLHGTEARSAATTAAIAGSTAKPSATTSTTATASAPTPPWTGGYNLYRKTAFVTQKDFKWCVAASVQMMVNTVRHESDRTAATQARMIRYAQASDHGPWGPGGGTDVTGWISALRHFGAGKYRAVGARSASAALRIAATAMRQTGRPAGMLVMEGRHAWILHGFESRTDPRRDSRARITSVRVSGPLYPAQQKNGYDLRPNTELSVRALARYFQPSSVGALVGRYVVIVPVH